MSPEKSLKPNNKSVGEKNVTIITFESYSIFFSFSFDVYEYISGGGIKNYEIIEISLFKHCNLYLPPPRGA